MRLIGMLDSPFVRRAAIAARLLGLPLRHEPISVFSTYAQFGAINPVVKAPSLVCDDGTVLMDSALIIDHFETLAGRSLWPAAGPERLRALRITGLALAACEKVMQTVYERQLRPADKLHAPWLVRLDEQMRAAFAGLEEMLAGAPLPADEAALTQADLCTAIAWRFMQIKLAQPLPDASYPALAAFSARVEAMPSFAQVPADDSVDVSNA